MFLGQIIDSEGIQPDPNKVMGIQSIPAPTNVGHVRRFLGMENQLVDVVVESLPVTERQLETIKLHQREDETCQLIASYWQTGWPEKHQLPAAVCPYHSVASEISVQQGLLMRGGRIIIPFSLRQEMLGKIHARHQGITKCRERTRQSVWWPRISKELDDLVKN